MNNGTMERPDDRLRDEIVAREARAGNPSETMNALSDIETPDDVKTLVDAFYAKVNRHALLAPVFNETANVDWAAHLPPMYRFGESMLFRTANYQGLPFPKHAVLPVKQEHFECWLALFVETIGENFSGTKSEEAEKSRGQYCRYLRATDGCPERSRRYWTDSLAGAIARERRGSHDCGHPYQTDLAHWIGACSFKTNIDGFAIAT